MYVILRMSQSIPVLLSLKLCRPMFIIKNDGNSSKYDIMF